MMDVFLAESSGIATVADSKKENPVRRRLEIKAGGYTYILEHACPWDRRIFNSVSD